MTYELAKKLKEAGFSQKTPLSPESYISGRRPDGKAFIETVGELVSYPTLEELIEACGKNFGGLIHNFLPGDTEWFAFMGSVHRTEFPENEGQHGSTPSEAVANLWLELNPHPQSEVRNK